MKFTDFEIGRYRLPPGRNEKIEWHASLPGFGVHFRRSGVNSFVIQYGSGGSRKRVTIGRVGEMRAAEAFEIAKDHKAKIRLGGDPALERAKAHRQSKETFGSLLPRFLQHVRWRPATRLRATRHLNQSFALLHPLPVAAIDRRTVSICLGEIEQASGPFARNNARAYLSAYFGWIVREGLRDDNPVVNTNKAETASRAHVPSSDDLRLIQTVLGEPGPPYLDYKAAGRLLLETGLRREEVGALRWSEIDLDKAVIVLSGKRTKNGEEHVVPLSDAAVAILRERAVERNLGKDRKHVFTRRDAGLLSWSAAKLAFDRRIAELNGGQPIVPWRLHDFRRAVSTWMHENGVAPHVVEAVLGHIAGHKAGVSGVYNRAGYNADRQKAVARWSAYLEGLRTGKAPTAEIVHLGARPR